MKKRSAKALAQHHDRTFAEFEARTRKLVKQPTPQISPERVNATGKKPIR
ncbi:MAG: hypothetical protein ACLPVY_18100 [Acidimicrobiia bacterium]